MLTRPINRAEDRRENSGTKPTASNWLRAIDESNPVTVIHSYLVTPDRQKALTDLLIAGTRNTFASVPGFVFAKIHRSIDGCRVAVYSQWQTREDYEAGLGRLEVQEFLDASKAMARSIDPRFYEDTGIITPALPVKYQR